jgi:hypothetical protein
VENCENSGSLTVLNQIDGLRVVIGSEFDDFYKDYEAKVSALPKEKRRLLESHQPVMEDTKVLPRLKNEQEMKKKEIDAVLGELWRHCELVAGHLDKRTQIRQEKVVALNKELEGFGVRLAAEPLAIRAGLESLAQKYSTGAKIYGELNSFAA